MRQVRMLDQLERAAEYGLLDGVDRFLRELPVND
jgi:hypothetical protein